MAVPGVDVDVDVDVELNAVEFATAAANPILFIPSLIDVIGPSFPSSSPSLLEISNIDAGGAGGATLR